MGGSDGECTGALLGPRRVVVRENSEGVSLRLRLKAWEGASWPRSEQREESSRRRNNARERSSGKDLGGIGGTEWRPGGRREDELGGQMEARRQSRPCRALQAVVWTSAILSAAEVIAGYQAGRR